MIEDKPIAFITGASSGIGAAFARALAQKGYDLILVARRLEKLKALKKTLNTKATCIQCDLSQPEELKKLVKRVSQRKPSLFIANAGMGLVHNFERANWQDVEQQINVMMTAHIQLTHALLPNMIKQKSGDIIFVNSIAGLILSSSPTYGALKSALHLFANNLRLRYAKSNLRIISLCPGLTRTEFHQTMNATQTYKKFPKSCWMEADTVVNRALRDLKNNKATSIPGLYNRLFYRLYCITPKVLWRQVYARFFLPKLA